MADDSTLPQIVRFAGKDFRVSSDGDDGAIKISALSPDLLPQIFARIATGWINEHVARLRQAKEGKPSE
jgi:hypothetical protein